MNRVSAENLGEGLYKLRKLLLESGYSIQTASWQGIKEPPTFLEILHADLVAKMSDDPKDASKICQAPQPWPETPVRLSATHTQNVCGHQRYKVFVFKLVT